MSLPSASARPRARWRLGVGSIAVLSALAACEFPTAVPQVDQTWMVPPQTTTIALANLLPAGVRILADSSAFALDVAPVSTSRALSADCSACAAANGTTVAKPAFVATVTATAALPAGFAAATLASGTLQLAVTNNYTFDPIRPSATARGYVVTTVANGATIIGRDSVDGATTALPPGATLTRSIALSGAISSASPVTVTITINSPAGDPVTMDASRTIAVTATPANLVVPTASVSVVNRPISASATADLRNIDSTITNHVTGGSLLLGVVNPFAVGGTITVLVSAPNVATITKTAQLAPGTTTDTLSLSQGELMPLFGHVVTMSFSGPVSGTNGAVAVAPRQAVVVTTHFVVTLHTGG